MLNMSAYWEIWEQYVFLAYFQECESKATAELLRTHTHAGRQKHTHTQLSTLSLADLQHCSNSALLQWQWEAKPEAWVPTLPSCCDSGKPSQRPEFQLGVSLISTITLSRRRWPINSARSQHYYIIGGSDPLTEHDIDWVPSQDGRHCSCKYRSHFENLDNLQNWELGRVRWQCGTLPQYRHESIYSSSWGLHNFPGAKFMSPRSVWKCYEVIERLIQLCTGFSQLLRGQLKEEAF